MNKKLIASVLGLSMLSAVIPVSSANVAAAKNAVRGDVNGDGRLNVADAAVLQKYLLGGNIELPNWKAADLCEDDCLNVFDLCLLKRELVGASSDDIYTEVWLRERYPQYFDLPAMKGLEVYVFQTTPDNYRCVLEMGTNRLKTDEEIEELFADSTSVDEMKAILSCYDIPESSIVIIPWQSSVWEYAYAMDSDYCRKLREMFFGEKKTISPSFDAGEIAEINVWTYPESLNSSRTYGTTENIKKVVSYLNGLHLSEDFPENPDEMAGFTYAVKLDFKNGDTKTIYLFGSMFYREDGDPWLRMDYNEAEQFGVLIDETPSAVE